MNTNSKVQPSSWRYENGFVQEVLQMSDKNIEKRHHSTFEQIKEQANDGKEFWTARKLSKVLDYSEYRHFLPVIDRAKDACRNSGHNIADHFEDFLGMVEIGSGAKRKLNVYKSLAMCILFAAS